MASQAADLGVQRPKRLSRSFCSTVTCHYLLHGFIVKHLRACWQRLAVEALSASLEIAIHRQILVLHLCAEQ